MDKTEQKLLNWCGFIIIASAILVVGIPVLLIETYALIRGQTERLEDPMFYYAVIFALVYLTSFYFLFTLEGKTIRRRIFSWAQSFIFHYCLFLVVAIFLYKSNEKFNVLVLLSPEFVVGTLSLVGFFVSRKDLRVSHD